MDLLSCSLSNYGHAFLASSAPTSCLGIPSREGQHCRLQLRAGRPFNSHSITAFLYNLRQQIYLVSFL